MSGQSDVHGTSSTSSRPTHVQARLDFELLEAVKHGTARETEDLIGNGADVNQVDENKDWTLLFSACERKQAPIGGRISLLRVLVLKHGLDPAHVEGRIGQTPLFFAAREGDRAACEFLIDQKATADFVDRLDQTPLFYAARKGHLETVQLLIERRAFIDRIDKKGTTPLFFAAMEGRVEIMELLLESKAWINHSNEQNRTCLWDAHKDALHCAVNARCDPNHRDRDDRTAIFKAASVGDVEKVDALVELGAQINLVDCYGSTCLFQAAKSGHVAAIARLCDKYGADACVRDKEGATARYHSELHSMKQAAAALQKAETKQKKAAEAKSKQTEKAEKDAGNRESLSDIVCQGTVEQVAAALAKGAQWDEVTTKNGQNLAFVVATRPPPFDSVKVCGMLCQGKGPVDLDQVDRQWNQTPLFFAVRDHPEGAGAKLVRFLLERRCDPNRQDMHVQTPLHYAAKRQDPACVELLLEFRAQVDVVDNLGLTPIFWAAGIGSSQASTHALLRAKADASRRDKMGRTLLFYASTVPIAELLLERRCFVDAQDDDRRICSFPHVQMGNVEVLELLIQMRADVNHSDNGGETCLFNAVRVADAEVAQKMVELLIDKAGASPNVANLRGDTPADEAFSAAIRKLIRSYCASRGSPTESDVNTDVSKKRRLTRKDSAGISVDNARNGRKLFQIVIQDQDGGKLRPNMPGYQDRLNEMLQRLPWLNGWTKTSL